VDIVQQHVPFANLADAAALVWLLVGAFNGWRRGLSGELPRLMSVVVAGACGFLVYGQLTAWIALHTRLQGDAAGALAFIAATLLAGAGMLAMRLILGSLVQIVFAAAINKPVGLVAGLVGSALVLVLLFVSLNLVPHEDLNRIFGAESALGRVVRRTVPIVREHWQSREEWKPEAVAP
jgi:uncharacterized membrane protein required for colicin V production